MIGDWVLTLESTHKEKVYAQIWAIEEGQTSILVKKDNCNWFVDIEWIEPIPLTPEILEKNGFRKLETYGTEKWLCDNLRLNVYSSDGTWRFCADTNRNENSVIYIRFVHELQHALRLCQIEKEIEL